MSGLLRDRIKARRPAPPPERDDRPEWIKRKDAGRLPARVDYGRTPA
jgi:hypothetical protein